MRRTSVTASSPKRWGGRALLGIVSGWLLACATPVVAPSPEAVRSLPPVVIQPSDDGPASVESVEPDVEPTRTESGVTWRVLRSGAGGVRPGINDTVVVHYRGTTADGVEFDSSRGRGRPARFGVARVIPGWTEILQRMVVGDRWVAVIPADLAYGDKPTRPGAPAGDLTFDIELLEVVVAPPVPDDVAAAPAHAITTSSGLAFVVLRKGLGRVRPGPTDKVEVHYSGWTTDGRLFDSSVVRGKSATFGLSHVIQGWTEALQLMSVGDVFRMWIPASMAYGDTPKRPGAPAGMLVFDVELLGIP